jgi:hypothetical protein
MQKKRNSYSSIRYKDKKNIVSVVSVVSIKDIIVSIKVQVKRNKENVDSIVSITI